MNRYLCIDNFNGMLALTVGKIYTSTRETENCIWITSDAGREEGYTRYTYFRITTASEVFVICERN